MKRHIRKFQVAVMQLGVYLETFLQAVMSVSHVVQLKFHVAVVESTLEPHHVCHVTEKGEENYKPSISKWEYTCGARDRCIFAVTEKWLELCCGG